MYFISRPTVNAITFGHEGEAETHQHVGLYLSTQSN